MLLSATYTGHVLKLYVPDLTCEVLRRSSRYKLRYMQFEWKRITFHHENVTSSYKNVSHILTEFIAIMYVITKGYAVFVSMASSSDPMMVNTATIFTIF